MSKMLCNSWKECVVPTCECGHKEEHEHDSCCDDFCGIPDGIPDSKCIEMKTMEEVDDG